MKSGCGSVLDDDLLCIPTNFADKGICDASHIPFHFIEHNFLAGRTFADLADLNAQARAWCDKVNATYKDHLHASPRELFAAERPHLQPLPLFIPEVYAAPDDILTALRQSGRRAVRVGQHQPVHEAITYIENHRELLGYPGARRRGRWFSKI